MGSDQMNLQDSNRIICQPTRGKNTDGEAGFTLIETAIALLVMMVAALAVTSLFVYAIRYNSGASDRALALAIAQQRMERLRKTPFSDATFNTASLTESYSTAGHPYTIVTTVCSTSDCGGSPELKVITVRVTPAVSSSQWAGTAATVISQRSTHVVGPYMR